MQVRIPAGGCHFNDVFIVRSGHFCAISMPTNWRPRGLENATLMSFLSANVSDRAPDAIARDVSAYEEEDGRAPTCPET